MSSLWLAINILSIGIMQGANKQYHACQTLKQKVVLLGEKSNKQISSRIPVFSVSL